MKSGFKKILVGSCLLFLIGLLVLIYSYFIEPNRLVINEQVLKIQNWNKEFDGLKIVAISDIHGGSNGVGIEKLQKIVEEINVQNADLVVFLGDYVSQVNSNKPIRERELKMSMAEIVDNLKGIKSKYGVFVILGNHDGWYKEDEIKTKFAGIGYKVLENEISIIEKNGQKLRILGLKDHLKMHNWKTFSDEAKKVVELSENQGDLLVLEHSPDVMPAVSGKFQISKDFKLFLAGHTHGGQVWFPVLGSLVVPSSYGQKYAFGHMKENDIDMFITTGIGTSVLPIRFLVPPEIAVLTIRAE